MNIDSNSTLENGGLTVREIRSYEDNIKTWFIYIKALKAERILALLGYKRRAPETIVDNGRTFRAAFADPLHDDLINRPLTYLIHLEESIEATIMKDVDVYNELLRSVPPANKQHNTRHWL